MLAGEGLWEKNAHPAGFHKGGGFSQEDYYAQFCPISLEFGFSGSVGAWVGGVGRESASAQLPCTPTGRDNVFW